MICLSIGNNTVIGVLEALKGISFAEIRLDLIEDLDIKGLEKIFSEPAKLISTFRTGSLTQELREPYLLKAIELETAYIDIDISSDNSFIKKIVNKTSEFNTKIIISYHNFESTPSYHDLIEIHRKGKDLGADIIKIACKVNNNSDNIRLLRLMENKDIISIGMGHMGKISRLAGHFLGSRITFASESREKKTAEGQIDLKTMKHLIEVIDE